MSSAAQCLDFKLHATALREQVDAALDGYSKYNEDCPPRLAAAIRHSLLAPGKRLRPMLVLMACDACGYNYAAALPAACAVEMIHTYSLIHDDLPAMDDDDMRRGLPSCHAKFGEATAILAGDALLAQAFEVIATGTQPPAAAARCCAELAKAAGASNLVGGQQDDLAAEFTERGSAVSRLEELQRIHRRKTGALISVSLRLGSIVAGADDECVNTLTRYGDRLGLAFQIVDDLLDTHGEEASLGKHIGKDEQHGKLTFPSLLGAEESRRRAALLIDEAIVALEPLGRRAEGLAGLARFVLERNQ